MLLSQNLNSCLYSLSLLITVNDLETWVKRLKVLKTVKSKHKMYTNILNKQTSVIRTPKFLLTPVPLLLGQ